MLARAQFPYTMMPGCYERGRSPTQPPSGRQRLDESAHEDLDVGDALRLHSSGAADPDRGARRMTGSSRSVHDDQGANRQYRRQRGRSFSPETPMHIYQPLLSYWQHRLLG